MTTEWWDTHSAEVAPPVTRAPIVPNDPPPEPVNAEEPSSVPAEGQGRKRAVQVVGGIAGVIVIGVLALGSMPDGDKGKAAASASVSAGPVEDLPAAGALPQGGRPAGGRQTQGTQPAGPAAIEQTVQLTATPSGKGRVGAIMKISISNGTDEPLTVLASLVKGDGRSAVVGEGTLAPGSRIIQPGETAEGTVEFSAARAPHQVSLFDLSGNLVAASN